MEMLPLDYMNIALGLAREGEKNGEVPVGAIIEFDGKIVGEGFNCPVSTSDPSGHAEIIAIREAGKNFGNYRLSGSVLYVTLEPCIMCYSVAVHARIKKIYYGADDPKGGIFSTGAFESIGYLYNHRIEIESGVLADESSELLKNFFRNRRGRDSNPGDL